MVEGEEGGDGGEAARVDEAIEEGFEAGVGAVVDGGVGADGDGVGLDEDVEGVALGGLVGVDAEEAEAVQGGGFDGEAGEGKEGGGSGRSWRCCSLFNNVKNW